MFLYFCFSSFIHLSYCLFAFHVIIAVLFTVQTWSMSAVLALGNHMIVKVITIESITDPHFETGESHPLPSGRPIEIRQGIAFLSSFFNSFVLYVSPFFWWRALQQVLRTHRSLEAYSVLPCNGAPVEWNWQGKTEVLGEKPVPVPLCPPQISPGLTRDRTRVSAVRSRRLTAWAMVRPSSLITSSVKIVNQLTH
jgi:hypothetical protein